MSSKVKKKPEKFRYSKGTFSVVKFYEHDSKSKSFDCIPDLWFVNEEKTLCYWPPKSKKSPTWRAMNQDEPDDDWSVYECELISEGHVTYSAGSSVAREKASQNYNTSSADEHIQEAKFRREHPGLIHKGEKCFENVFAAAKAAEVHEKGQPNVSKQKTSNEMVKDSDVTNEASTSQSRSRTKSSSNPYRSSVRSNTNNNHSDGSRSRSRSNNSPSLSDHSQPRSNYSQQRRSHSQPRRSHSKSRSNHSQSGRSHSESRRSHSKSRSNHSQSGRSHYESRRSHSESRRSHSKSRRSHSESRSNHSEPHRNHFSSYNTQSQSHSRSRSNNSAIRSESRSYRTRSRSSHSQSIRDRSKSRSKSYHSKSDYSQSRSNYSQRHSRSQSRKRRSKSGSKKSQSSRSIRMTNRDNSGRSQLPLRTNDWNDLRRSSSSSKVERRYTYQQREMHNTFMNHVRQTENNSQKNNSSASRSRHKMRNEETVRLHQEQVANRSMISRNVRTVSSRDMRSYRSNSQHQHHRDNSSPGLLDIHSNNDSTLLQTLVKEVREIKKIVSKNDRRFVESDRRLTRLETTANKTFIVLGDLSNAINARMLLGNVLQRENRPPKGFHTPKFPIKRFQQLGVVNKDLKNKDFFNYLVQCEKEYCCYSSSTDTATMTSYLRRFIDVDLRASIVLKDLKGQQGLTLYHDFHNVYLFLIETMKEGYRIKNQLMSNKDVHLVLRTVWGRSKQAAEEANKKR